MSRLFDPFGALVRHRHDGRGRQQILANLEKRIRFNVLAAAGWSDERIASALRVTAPTKREHYFSALIFRHVARDLLVAQRDQNPLGNLFRLGMGFFGKRGAGAPLRSAECCSGSAPHSCDQQFRKRFFFSTEAKENGRD
jgi:hypothetical protein